MARTAAVVISASAGNGLTQNDCLSTRSLFGVQRNNSCATALKFHQCSWMLQRFPESIDSVINLVEKWFIWLFAVTNGAFRNCPCVSLVLDCLYIVSGCHCGASRMLRAVAGGAVNTTMATRIFKELSWFFKLEVWFSFLMATGACRFIDPGAAKGVGDSCHCAMTLDAADSLRNVHVALTVCLESRMARITCISQACYGSHSRSMRAMHRL
jgi:hypothetical protein